jgi:hypothetical protein
VPLDFPLDDNGQLQHLSSEHGGGGIRAFDGPGYSDAEYSHLYHQHSHEQSEHGELVLDDPMQF